MNYPVIDGNKYERLIFMSDIHGFYGSFKEMRKKVGLKKGDLLVLAGDLFDRGPDSMGLWRDVTSEHDYETISLLGNHELMILEWMATDYGTRHGLPYFYNTNLQFMECSKKEMMELKAWLKEIPNYVEIVVGDGEARKVFAVAHATTRFPEDEYTSVWGDDGELYKCGSIGDGKISVTGHDHTAWIRSFLGEGMPASYDIWKNEEETIFAIDCGNGARNYQNGGKLGALIVHTGTMAMEEVYV